MCIRDSPWEAAWVSDGEVTPYVTGVNDHTGEPMICLTGVSEQHITSDIIFALWQYYATTDEICIRDSNSASATEKGGKTESASDGGEITLTIPTFFVGENVGAVYFEPCLLYTSRCV